MCSFVSLSFKISTLVAMVALVVTVHILHTETDSLSRQLKEARDDLSSSYKQRDSALSIVTNTEAKMSQLQTKLNEAEKKIADLNSRASTSDVLQKELTSKKSEMEKLTATVRQLEEDKKNVQAKVIEASKSEVTKLKSELAGVQKKAQVLEDSLTGKEKEVEKVKAAEVSAKKETQEVTQKLKEADKLRLELEATVSAKDKTIGDLTVQVKQMETNAKTEGMQCLKMLGSFEEKLGLQGLEMEKVKAAEVSAKKETQEVTHKLREAHKLRLELEATVSAKDKTIGDLTVQLKQMETNAKTEGTQCLKLLGSFEEKLGLQGLEMEKVKAAEVSAKKETQEVTQKLREAHKLRLELEATVSAKDKTIGDLTVQLKQMETNAKVA